MALKLKLHTQPDVPLEVDCISPDRLQSLSNSEISKQTIFHGNRQVNLGDFFDCIGDFDNEIIIEGDCSNIKHIGTAMSFGQITIEGDVGTHTGAVMSGGEINIEGSGADWLGAEMLGGRITVKGDAGHMVGSAYRGSAQGMQGGEIIVHGNVRNEMGHAMRRGLIAVGGNADDFAGVNMLAGTIIVLGDMGIRTGAGMKRGSIICQNIIDILPTFSRSCDYQPSFLRQYYKYLKSMGLTINDSFLDGPFERWCGDSVELNRGEILLYAGK
ncbi:MAG: formylmethanofuran dehydrogenase subunit C [Proteobacteria bacterium]|nr:formylmethanofuran dehydrogenase subunit C [Pseudomonadota bacterium]NOG59223.1 formylmethanofuran dehydrogenase subunit C [Pseudomonadota bacterium]